MCNGLKSSMWYQYLKVNKTSNSTDKAEPSVEGRAAKRKTKKCLRKYSRQA